jgi:FecR-like protein
MMDDRTTERLLEWAGRRPDIPTARAQRIRAGVYDVWRTEVHRRRRRQRLRTMAALTLGTLIVTVAGITLWRWPAGLPVVVVGTIDRVENVTGLAPGENIRAGQWITIGRGARLALHTLRGTSVRLDEHTRLRLISQNTIEVMAGAAYFDTGSEAGPLEIRTPVGHVTDIGTQFEVRLIADALRVRVRTGMVSVRSARESLRVEEGTEVVLGPQGAAHRIVSPVAADWEWAARIAPPLRFEGERLAEFLRSLARENSWRLRYEDAALERTAAAVVLHGSVEGLDGKAALAVALAIADLRYRLEGGDLFVSREAPGK